jgi:uncharacterized protein YjbJ (UPF0337 family)
MNSDTFAGQWKQLKGSAKKQWADLTDNDLLAAEGSYDKFVGVIQERYGYAKERAEAEVNEWMDSADSESRRPTSGEAHRPSSR